MSVLFHIASRAEWDDAIQQGVYEPASLSTDGFVHCSTAEQHSEVANALFAGRRDLVLLLIDASRVVSEVRLEGADRHGRPFPHIYGAVELDAVFEAAPYDPGADGRFQMHEEASGFVAWGAATLEDTAERARSVMAGFPAPWWIAGGWAVDLLLGRKTRPHADLEISIPRSAQRVLLAHLRGWDLRLATPEHTLEIWDGGPIELPYHQIWARSGPGRPPTPEEFSRDPTMLDFLLEQERDGRWVFRRHPSITRELDEVVTTSAEGVPIVRPEIGLLFKAKYLRYKDQRDFDRLLPHLGDPARRWLVSALRQVHPGHPWLNRMA